MRLLFSDSPEVTINMLKQMNSLGIFKNDEIWFPTYYTYNTAWNYSDASEKLARVGEPCLFLLLFSDSNSSRDLVLTSLTRLIQYSGRIIFIWGPRQPAF